MQVLKDILLTVRTNMHEIGDIPLLIEMESKQKAHRAGAEDAWDKGRTKKPNLIGIYRKKCPYLRK